MADITITLTDEQADAMVMALRNEMFTDQASIENSRIYDAIIDIIGEAGNLPSS